MANPSATPTPSLDSGPCPCGSGRSYAACCGCWHAGPQAGTAPTPEALMRSRYSAYVLGLGDYLLQTWHPDTRPREPLVFDPAQQWLRLEVREAPPPSGDQGVVTFVAVSKLGGRAHRLHERSRFVRVAGRWLYLDGELR